MWDISHRMQSKSAKFTGVKGFCLHVPSFQVTKELISVKVKLTIVKGRISKVFNI